MNLQHHASFPPLARRALSLRRVQHRALEPETCTFDTALAHFMRQDYAGAFDALSRLADNGHAAAARMALLMARRGTRLFGHRFVASIESCRRWQTLADTACEAA